MANDFIKRKVGDLNVGDIMKIGNDYLSINSIIPYTNESSMLKYNNGVNIFNNNETVDVVINDRKSNYIK